MKPRFRVCKISPLEIEDFDFFKERCRCFDFVVANMQGIYGLRLL